MTTNPQPEAKEEEHSHRFPIGPGLYWLGSNYSRICIACGEVVVFTIVSQAQLRAATAEAEEWDDWIIRAIEFIERHKDGSAYAIKLLEDANRLDRDSAIQEPPHV